MWFAWFHRYAVVTNCSARLLDDSGDKIIIAHRDATRDQEYVAVGQKLTKRFQKDIGPVCCGEP